MGDAADMGPKTISVLFFRDFEVFYGDKTIVSAESRRSRVAMLLQYLLYYRERMIPQRELLCAVVDEQTDNPSSSLKNLVYRLRKLLEDAGMDSRCLRYARNCYGFFPDGPFVSDVRAFLGHAEKAKSGNAAEQFDEEMAAIRQYRGDFLAYFNYLSWVAEVSVQYQESFIHLLEAAFRHGSEVGRLSELLPHLSTATVLFPYSEEICCLYIECLFRTQRIREALEQYGKVEKRLLDDLGVEPSGRLKELNRLMMGALNERSRSVREYRQSIALPAEECAAFVCSPEVFVNIYRLTARQVKRSGQSVFLMLWTLRDSGGDELSAGNQLREAAEHFAASAAGSLRQGDVLTRSSAAQFAVLLMNISYEHCRIVEDRIRARFFDRPKMMGLRLSCEFISAVELDQIICEFAK